MSALCIFKPEETLVFLNNMIGKKYTKYKYDFAKNSYEITYEYEFNNYEDISEWLSLGDQVIVNKLIDESNYDLPHCVFHYIGGYSDVVITDILMKDSSPKVVSEWLYELALYVINELQLKRISLSFELVKDIEAEKFRGEFKMNIDEKRLTLRG